jgi:cell division ATPase FtsA
MKSEAEIRTMLTMLTKKHKDELAMHVDIGIGTTTIHVNKTKGEIKSLKWVLNELK